MYRRRRQDPWGLNAVIDSLSPAIEIALTASLYMLSTLARIGYRDGHPANHGKNHPRFVPALQDSQEDHSLAGHGV